MSKVLSISSVLVTLFAVISCGVRKNSALNYQDEQGYFKASIVSGNCGGEKAVNLVKSSSKLIQNIKNQSSLQGYQYLNQLTTLMGGRGNFLTPIILGSSEIKKKTSELEALFEIEKERSFLGTNWKTLLDKSEFLDMSIKRWSFHQCHLTDLIDGNSEELSNYLEIESLYCKEGCSQSDFKRKLSDADLRKKFIKMCSLVERKNSCAVTYDIALINDRKIEYIQEKLSAVKDYFNKEVFGVKNPAFNFNCNKEKNYYEFIIPISNSPGRYELEGAIKKYWENDQFKVKFVSNERGVELLYTDSEVSSVERSNPSVIRLNRKLGGEFRVKTIAHEFGHVLGLRDCYFEYYNTSKEEIVYYELERSKGNLMCSLSYGTNIPKKYSETLIQKFCN